MRYLLALAFGCAMWSSAVQAQERPDGACRADIQKYCKDATPGGGAMVRCLAQHESQLSETCRERLTESRQRMKEFGQACKADADQLCKQVQPGGGRTMRCLAQNKDRLSSACREQVAQVEERHPCMADVERFCKEVPPEGGAFRRCLGEHRTELSPACKAAFDRSRKKKP